MMTFTPQIENRPKEVGSLVDWSSCVICLEDFPPHLLQSHENCNMVSFRICLVGFEIVLFPD